MTQIPPAVSSEQRLDRIGTAIDVTGLPRSTPERRWSQEEVVACRKGFNSGLGVAVLIMDRARSEHVLNGRDGPARALDDLITQIFDRGLEDVHVDPRR